MKRVIAFILVIMLMLCEMVCAEGIGTQIDSDALKRYADFESADAADAGVPVSVTARELYGRWVMMEYYDVGFERKAKMEDVLTSDPLPCDLSIVYDNYDNSIIFMFNRSTVEEIPQSVEVYADGKLLKGTLNILPAEVNAETQTVGFFFSLEEVKCILDADDVFMRLITDQGTSFLEMSVEKMPVPYIMLVSVYAGARYSLIDDILYLESWLLPEEFQDWKPPVTINDALSGVTFTVMDGWSSQVMAQTNDMYVVGLTKDTSDDFHAIIYMCTDILTLLDAEKRLAIEQDGVTRSELDDIFFQPNSMSIIAGVSKEDLVLLKYAGKEYYSYMFQSDETTGWGVIGMHDGYVLKSTYYAPASTEATLQVMENFLNTFQFP